MAENLSICVIDHSQKIVKKISYVVGEIAINDFCESFDMPLEWWAIEDYERQWKEGIERIKTHDKSCLIMKIYNLEKHPFIDWWLLYKEGSKIIIRNEVLFREYYEEIVGEGIFTTETCYDFIPNKTSRVTPSGYEASEWVVQLDAQSAI